MPVLYIILSILDRHNLWLAGLLGVLLALHYFVAVKYIHLMRLFVGKMIVLQNASLPASSICVAEISKVPDMDGPPALVERTLKVVTVSADCPICAELYKLRESVLLERKGFLNREIVGVCTNNPMMHRYTFDKDMMRGKRLELV